MKSADKDTRLLALAFAGSVLFHTLVIFAIDFRFETRESAPRILNVQLVQTSPTPSVLEDNLEPVFDEGQEPLNSDSSIAVQAPITEPTSDQNEIEVVAAESPADLQPENITPDDQLNAPNTEPRTDMEDVSSTNTSLTLSPQISIQDLISSVAVIALEQSGEQNVRNITMDDATNTEEEYYLKAWLKKVQEIGQLNYPQEAIEKKLYGKLRLYVSIKPDGSVEETRVVRSSGHEVLDEAAKHIVELASPFSAFPQAMRESIDLLEIVREWEFRKEALVPTSDSDEE